MRWSLLDTPFPGRPVSPGICGHERILSSRKGPEHDEFSPVGPRAVTESCAVAGLFPGPQALGNQQGQGQTWTLLSQSSQPGSL